MFLFDSDGVICLIYIYKIYLLLYIYILYNILIINNIIYYIDTPNAYLDFYLIFLKSEFK